MAYDLIKVSALPETTPDESQDIVVGVGDYAKRINYGDVKADMVGTSPTYTTDTEPYLMRRTAHTGVVGKCALNKLVGGSLGWNQLCNGSSVTVPSGHKYYMKKSGTASIGASTGSALTGLTSGTDMVIDLTQMFGSTIADYVYGLGVTNGIAWLSQYIDLGTYHAYDVGSIQSVQATAHVTTGKNFLTDYVNHASPGVFNGVTFTKNADGTITLNGTATAATLYYLSSRSVLPETVGLRLPKGNYILSGTPTGYSSYNLRLDMNRGGNGDTIGNDTGSGCAFTEPEGTAVTYGVWIGFNSGAVFSNVVIKPMVRYATADSTYVPYQKRTYPLGSDTLRGIPQLVNNELQFDGDIKTPDGKTRRRYGYLNLGTLTWNKHGIYTNCFGATLSGVNAPSPSNTCAPCVCARYVAVYGADITLSRITSTDSSGCAFLSPSRWSTANPTIVINDTSYTSSTAEQFKAAMSGVYLVYPLATQTTESSTAYQKVQTIDADGTESFTVSSPVPVGHETQTPDNILAALEWLGE